MMEKNMELDLKKSFTVKHGS